VYYSGPPYFFQWSIQVLIHSNLSLFPAGTFKGFIDQIKPVDRGNLDGKRIKMA
jgi:hypothetical protein